MGDDKRLMKIGQLECDLQMVHPTLFVGSLPGKSNGFRRRLIRRAC